MRLRKRDRSLAPTASLTPVLFGPSSGIEHHDSAMSTPRVLILAATFALVAVAYGISNLMLEVSLSLYDPDPVSTSEDVAIHTTATSRSKRQEPSQSDTVAANGIAVPKNNSPPSSTLEFKMVTMNIAGLVPSQSAPDSWSMAQQKDKLGTEILASDPDIIALQECPSPDWATNSGVFNQNNEDDNGTTYNLVGSAPSHAGYVSLLTRVGLDANALALGEEDSLPIVAGTISWQGKQIVVASVHLHPFEQGSFRRKEQVESLLAASAAADALIFSGDTNMRDSEDATMEESLHLMDAWKIAGSLGTTRFSWDTIPHHDDGEDQEESFEWQNLYYGAATRAYQRRYDRIYVRSSPQQQPASLQVHVPVFDLIANRPVSESPYHFLSDHFGIALQLELSWMA